MIAYSRILGVICLIFSLAVGCSPQNTAPRQSPTPQRTSYIQRVKQTTPDNKYTKSGQAVANRLEQIAERMPHVRDATAIALGNYAIIGLDLDPKLDRGQVGTVKYSVAEALQNDTRGPNAGANNGPNAGANNGPNAGANNGPNAGANNGPNAGATNGSNILVTADTDLVQRLKNVRTDIMQGRPISGIMEELAGIAERITPQPTKVVPRQDQTNNR